MKWISSRMGWQKISGDFFLQLWNSCTKTATKSCIANQWKKYPNDRLLVQNLHTMKRGKTKETFCLSASTGLRLSFRTKDLIFFPTIQFWSRKAYQRWGVVWCWELVDVLFLVFGQLFQCPPGLRGHDDSQTIVFFSKNSAPPFSPSKSFVQRR